MGACDTSDMRVLVEGREIVILFVSLSSFLRLAGECKIPDLEVVAGR